MGLIKSILFWLFIFVVGSLIVSWILNGSFISLFNLASNTIQSFKDNSNKEFQEEIQIQDNLIEIETGEGTCSQIDSISDVSRISRSEGRSKVCDYICSINDGETSVQSTKCVNDKLICYCQ